MRSNECFLSALDGDREGIEPQTRFPFKRMDINENRKKRKRLHWQALQPIMAATASTERSYWLALAFVAWNFAWKFHATNASEAKFGRSSVAIMISCLPTQALAFLAVFVYATQAIAFEWKPGFTLCQLLLMECTLPPLLFLHCRFFRTWWDGDCVRVDMWRGNWLTRFT